MSEARFEGKIDLINLKINLILAAMTIVGLPALGLLARIAVKVGAF